MFGSTTVRTAAALAALHPAHYLVRLRTPSQLASAGEVRWVTPREYATIFIDPNVGLLPQVPVYAAAVLAGGLPLAFCAPRRLASAGIVAALASGAWLAIMAATAANVNHGGTPGLSRCATCYANRTKAGCEFVSPRVSAPQAFRLDRRRTWPRSAELLVAEALASLAWWNMSPRKAGGLDTAIQSSRHVGHIVVWQAENRFCAFAADVRPGAELVAQVAQELSVALTIESGPIDGTRVRLRPGLGRQAIALPSPQPWVMIVAEAR